MAVALCREIQNARRGDEPGMAFEKGQKNARPSGGVMEIIKSKSNFSILSIAGLAMGFLSYASEVQGAIKCPANKVPVNVVLKSGQGKITYNKKLSVKAINRLAAKAGKAPLERNSKVLGLTRYDPQFQFKTRTSTLEVQRRIYCASIASVQLWVGFTEFTVYLPKDYRAGGCQYNVIYEHENRHVAVSRRTLKNHLPKLEKRLKQLVRAMKPVVASSREIASNRILKHLTQRMDSAVTAFKRDLRWANKQVDLNENGLSVRNKCERW